MKIHSIDISFPNAGSDKANSLAKSLHQHLTNIDLRQLELAIARESPPEGSTTPTVKLAFDPASIASVTASISEWHKQSDVESIQVKLNDGRTFEKKRDLPDDDFKKE